MSLMRTSRNIGDEIDESKVPRPSRVVEARPGEPSKRCSGPLHRGGVYLTIASFYANAGRRDGLASRCKDCESYWNAMVPEQKTERNRRWLANQIPGYKELSEDLQPYARESRYELPDEDAAHEALRRYLEGE
jgi:hypothetical protein